MTVYDKLWNMSFEQLVKFKRFNGHCRVPKSYEQDTYLGQWVSTQRIFHKNNKLRLDRKDLLDEIGFAWTSGDAHKFKPDDKLWHRQYEKLVEFKQKNGHCMVPCRYEQDKSLGRWVGTQRNDHNKNKIRPDREERLDEIGFAWKYTALAGRASNTDVRGLVICIISRFGHTDYVSHSCYFSASLCRIWIRKRSPGPAVRVSQTKHQQKNRNHNKAMLEAKIHLLTEKDQVSALPKPDRWPLLVQTKEAML
jgi:hypothetical protein